MSRAQILISGSCVGFEVLGLVLSVFTRVWLFLILSSIMVSIIILGRISRGMDLLVKGAIGASIGISFYGAFVSQLLLFATEDSQFYRIWADILLFGPLLPSVIFYVGLILFTVIICIHQENGRGESIYHFRVPYDVVTYTPYNEISMKTAVECVDSAAGIASFDDDDDSIVIGTPTASPAAT
ncbi:hypothetical protein PCE1_003938 [Barthelona sp. PCE]